MAFPLYFLRAASSFAANSFVSSAAVTTASFSFFSWATSDAAREQHSTADARSDRTGLRMRIEQLLGARIHNKARPTARSALSRWFRRGKPASLFYDNALNLRPIDLLG